MTEASAGVLGALAGAPDRLELTTSADDASVDATQDLVADLWRRHPDVPSQVRQSFETAVIEVLGNVVTHAFATHFTSHLSGHLSGHADTSPAPEPEVLVVVAVRADDVIGVISDNAAPSYVDLEHAALPDFEAESGRGLAMAQAVTSELSLARVGERNVWTLRCDLR